MEQAIIKDMLNIKEFLALYPISRRVFYLEVKKKKLKIRKLGRRTYILKKDADIWMDLLETPK